MIPNSIIHIAILANLAVIRQGIVLISRLGESQFTAPVPICYNASIGGHLRHIIEHYQSFIGGLGDGEIDYENRRRDAKIESNPAHAAETMTKIIEQLEGLADRLTNRGLLYCSETSQGIATATSVLRELEFLLSHTIHHYALVAVMARLQGCEPEAEFGIAPSTLKFQRSQAQCAR